MIRRPPRSTQSRSSAASDVYKRQGGIFEQRPAAVLDPAGLVPGRWWTAGRGSAATLRTGQRGSASCLVAFEVPGPAAGLVDGLVGGGDQVERVHTLACLGSLGVGGLLERGAEVHADRLQRGASGFAELVVEPFQGGGVLALRGPHDLAGRVVWAAEGKNAATLEGFYDQLDEAGCTTLEAVSMDLGAAFKKATDAKAPQARQCVDPFHLIALANEAINKARRWAWNLERDKARRAAALAGPKRRGRPPTGSPPPARDQARWVKHSRWALLKDPAALKPSQLEVLHELRRGGSVLYRCWQLKEGLRELYRLPDPADAEHHLDWWLAWACRNRIPAFVTLSQTVRGNRDRILAAIELGLSNSKLEGLNSKIRLINHRGYGHHSAAALIAMIYLCCGGITIQLPTER